MFTYNISCHRVSEQDEDKYGEEECGPLREHHKTQEDDPQVRSYSDFLQFAGALLTHNLLEWYLPRVHFDHLKIQE